jgi:hypothetical protein
VALSHAHKLPKTHLESVTEKGDQPGEETLTPGLSPLQAAREQGFDREFRKLNRAAKAVIEQVALRGSTINDVIRYLTEKGFADPQAAFQAALDSGLIERDMVGNLAITSAMKDIAEQHFSATGTGTVSPDHPEDN